MLQSSLLLPLLVSGLLSRSAAKILVMVNITIIIINLGLLRVRHPSFWRPQCRPGSEQNRGVAGWPVVPLERFCGPLLNTPAAPTKQRLAANVRALVSCSVVVAWAGPLTAHIETQMTAVIG